MTMDHRLREAIGDKSATIGVIGLGYVGLPLISAFVAAGFRCMGFDVDQKKVDSLNAGQSYIKHISSETVADWISNDHLEPTSDMARLSEADVLLICVPTPLSDSRDPDLSYVEGTARAIAKTLRPGQLVVLESTTYPTTTRDVLLPILLESGLKPGEDFFLVYSPEREDPGNPDYSAAGIPKVVGGLDKESSELAEALYSHAIVQVVPVSSPEIAEACKILENTYRAVNIALVNELKTLFDRLGIDIWEVVDAAKTKPFGFQPFYPGPGLGGHCIPIDPFYLTWLARKQGLATRFIELAGEVNSRMPEYVISRLADFLNEETKPIRGSKIALLGMAYKKDVDDPRESPSFELLDLLMKRGANVSYNDPHIASLPKMRHWDVPEMTSCELTPEYLAEQDCVLIATDHTAYDADFIVQHSKMVLDTRNATINVTEGREKIRKA
ncbi:MAG: nucleotide sugar dehydrogenase [Planctomycetaceae bacterium]|nr:nucleotide sugar dehydrogenase [Planctomycetaceae bacterium]MBT6156006.1 nucleotide sugar dehydrogenase [Planctomycetaceae bacterium]MBT6487553.1 nucleotide sugar dehydrogenase [Planctomycetaceae bacterium]MBT6498214.1 nucleotide sugar dehydrogenase [Planctomycetaceae bacterium]